MVDYLPLILTVLGLTASIIYYATILRNATKNQKIAYSNTAIQYFVSEDSINKWMELMKMKWTDFDDFKNKYDSRNNPENYNRRIELWLKCDNLGYLYKAGLIDIDTINNVSGLFVEASWAKFKPIVEAYRGTDFSSNGFNNWEYLAMAVKKKRNEQQGESWVFLDSLWKGSQYK
jgi:hypothetical protein